MARRRRRSAMTRLFILLIGLILFVGGVLFVASRLLSPDFIAGQLVAAVKQQTGRTLVIEGSPRISFWPELSVRLSGVSLSNPPSMGSGLFMKAGEIDLAVAARPLLQQRLEVRRIVLRNPTVNLLVDGKGRQNWDFSTTSGKAAVSGGEGGKSGGGGKNTGLSVFRAPCCVLTQPPATAKNKTPTITHTSRFFILPSIVPYPLLIFTLTQFFLDTHPADAQA